MLEYSTSINLLTGHHLELLSLKKGAPARLSLIPSKCHKVVVAQMWLAKRRLVYDLFCRQILKQSGFRENFQRISFGNFHENLIVLLLSNKGAVQTANHRGKQNSTLYRYMYSVAELA